MDRVVHECVVCRRDRASAVADERALAFSGRTCEKPIAVWAINDRLRASAVDAGWDVPMYALGAVVYVERNDEILLLKRSQGSALDGQWFLPGGGIERGELPEEGARWVRPQDMQVLLNDDSIVQLAAGDERIEGLLRHIAADLDTYIRQTS